MVRKKRKYCSVLPDLEELFNQLQRWFGGDGDDHIDAVDILTIQQAKKAVSVTMNNHNVSYDESFNGWWRWHLRTIEARGEDDRRDSLRHDAIKHASEAPRDEIQLVKLSPNIDHSTDLPHPDLVEVLKQLQPTADMGHTRQEALSQADRLATKLVPFLEHDDPDNNGFDFLWRDAKTGQEYREDVDSLKGLFFRLWEVTKNNGRAVTLSLRVKPDTPLYDICIALDDKYQMTREICPQETWCFGPPMLQARVESPDVIEKAHQERYKKAKSFRLAHGEDKRYYLIIGTPGALTRSHWDRGVQAVLYHTVAGTNHALAVPRQVALMLSAINDGSNGTQESIQWSHELECKALQETTVKAGTFLSGETMLIMPGGGHLVLTGGDGKVVIAGEWHLDTVPLAR